LDDILVFSSTREEHLEHTQIVFDWLRKKWVKIKIKKCGFLQEYLGFVINKNGISPYKNKVKVIRSLKHLQLL
jgi:hypothetical protein